MRRSLVLITIALCSILTYAESIAQDTTLARIIYTNSERTAILAKTVSVTKVDTLFQSAGSVQVKNLAVLASTKDGNSLLIAGKAVFLNPINNALDSAWAIARIDAPFKNTGFFNPLTLTLGGAKILQVITTTQSIDPFTKMLPLGVLTPDEKEWYATPLKMAPGQGQQWFFHGKFDGSGTVDSVYVRGVNADAAAIGGYHMANLATSDDGQTMLAFVFDQCLTSDKPRAQLFRWKPTTPNGSIAFLADKIQTIPNFRNGGNIDTCFGFLFRVVPGQANPTAEIALAPNTTGDLTLYSFRWDAGASIALTASSQKILRSKLPNSLHFFTGITGSPLTPDDDKEVITPEQGAPNGNGGDMMFSPDGSSVVFVTCRGDDFATAAESGIYIYDLSKGTVTLVENDPLKMERQPVFTKSVIHKFVPPPYTVGTASLDKTSLDFGTHVDDGTDKTSMISTLTASNASEVIVTQATIGGADAANFSVTLSPSLPATVKGHMTYLFPVTFAPTAVKSYTATLTIHYIDSLRKNENDSILTIQLTGSGKKPAGGVNAKAPAAFDLSVIPNPFTQSTQITVTAEETGSTSLEVHDVLGKEIYSSRSLMLGVGEKFIYTLDANALHLSPGEYFVLVRSGGVEVSRKVIFVK